MTGKISSSIEKKINNASPVELVIIAYDGAIDTLRTASKNLKAKKLKDFKTDISKAKKIILQLKKALNMEVEEISRNLFTVYSATEELLDTALKNKDLKPIDQSIKMLLELKEAWIIISKQN